MNEVDLHGDVPAIQAEDLTRKDLGRKAFVRGENFQVAGRIKNIEFGGFSTNQVKVTLDLGDAGRVYLHLEPYEEVFVSV